MMKTVKKLGKLVKQKYPDYDDMPDEEVGRLVKLQYPGAYDDFLDFSPSPRLSEQIQHIKDYSNTKRGRITSSWREGQSKARSRLDGQLAGEIAAKLNLEHTIGRRIEDRVREHATSRHSVMRLNEAAERGVSLEALDEIRKEEEKARSEVEKHRGMKEVDKEVYLFEKEIDVQGAIIARIAEHYEIEVLTEAFNRAVDRRGVLLLDADTDARRRKLKRIDKNIKALDKAIDGKGQRLIQGNSRPELGTGDEG